jgi:hypothetical protein
MQNAIQRADKSKPPNAPGETFMSVAVKIARKNISARNGHAHHIEKPATQRGKLALPKY